MQPKRKLNALLNETKTITAKTTTKNTYKAKTNTPNKNRHQTSKEMTNSPVLESHIALNVGI